MSLSARGANNVEIATESDLQPYRNVIPFVAAGLAQVDVDLAASVSDNKISVTSAMDREQKDLVGQVNGVRQVFDQGVAAVNSQRLGDKVTNEAIQRFIKLVRRVSDDVAKEKEPFVTQSVAIEEQKQQLSTLREDLGRIESELREAQFNLRKVTEQNAQLRQTNASLERQNDALAKATPDLDAQVRECSAERERQKESYERQIDDLTSQLKSARAEENRLERRVKELDSNRAISEREANRLKDNLRELQNTLSEVRSKCSELETSNNELESEDKQQEVEILELRSQLRSATDSVASLSKELEDCKKRSADLELELEKETGQKIPDANTGAIEELRSQVKRLEKELAECRKQALSTEQELEDVKEDDREKTQEVEKLRRERDTLKQVNDDLGKKEDELKKRVEEEKKETQQLKREVKMQARRADDVVKGVTKDPWVVKRTAVELCLSATRVCNESKLIKSIRYLGAEDPQSVEIVVSNPRGDLRSLSLEIKDDGEPVMFEFTPQDGAPYAPDTVRILVQPTSGPTKWFFRGNDIVLLLDKATFDPLQAARDFGIAPVFIVYLREFKTPGNVLTDQRSVAITRWGEGKPVQTAPPAEVVEEVEEVEELPSIAPPVPLRQSSGLRQSGTGASSEIAWVEQNPERKLQVVRATASGEAADKLVYGFQTPKLEPGAVTSSIDMTLIGGGSRVTICDLSETQKFDLLALLKQLNDPVGEEDGLPESIRVNLEIYAYSASLPDAQRDFTKVVYAPDVDEYNPKARGAAKDLTIKVFLCEKSGVVSTFQEDSYILRLTGRTNQSPPKVFSTQKSVDTEPARPERIILTSSSQNPTAPQIDSVRPRVAATQSSPSTTTTTTSTSTASSRIGQLFGFSGYE